MCTLVNAKEGTDGKLEETTERTGTMGMEAYPSGRWQRGLYSELQGDMAFENVDFGYVTDKIVLHDIQLYAKPGQKIAFVGSTGAGKTTITNLINQISMIFSDGKIRYDGINLNKIKKHDLTTVSGHCIAGYASVYRNSYGKYPLW